MKIMFAIHSLENVGGAETILTRFANFFAKKGHEITIATLSNKKVNFELEPSITVKHFKQEHKGQLYFPKRIYAQVQHIVSASKVFSPDIFVSFVSATNVITILASMITKIPVVISERSSYHRGVQNRLWRILRRIVYPYADRLIILTKEDELKYHYISKVDVIPNPLQIKNEYSNIQRENIIFAVGRLHYIKGYDMLLEAFSKLKNNSWKLMIAGEGEERLELEKIIKEKNLEDRVELLGLIRDLETYYKKASIYVLSSRSEGFPGALCEAMGYGCASVAFDCPTGPKEIISNNKNGLLVDAENIEALTKAIDKLIENQEKRITLGNHAKKLIAKLDMNTIGSTWEDIFKEVIITRKENYDKKNKIYI